MNSKPIVVWLVLMMICSFSAAQITITSQDLPSANDTFRVSNGMISPLIDPVPTGANFNWDFSTLQWTTQDVDSFLTVSSTGPIYSLTFIDIAFNSNRANMANKGVNIQTPPIGGITISDVVNFYYKSSSVFQQPGFGASVNGIGLPVTFNSKDRIYNLPLNFNDNDSSYSDYQITLPGLGFYGHEQVRLSEVDGWGTLITPFGSFNTLRVKSVITSTDTLFLDTLGIGFGFSLPQTTEYKWLGLQGGIPLLQINTTVPPFGNEIITSIVYRDSLRTTTGLHDPESELSFFNIYPNPANGPVQFNIGTTNTQKGEVHVYSSDGKNVGVLWKGTVNKGSNKIFINTDALNLSGGCYFIELILEDTSYFRKLLVTSN